MRQEFRVQRICVVMNEKYKNIKRKIWDKNKKLRVFFIFIYIFLLLFKKLKRIFERNSKHSNNLQKSFPNFTKSFTQKNYGSFESFNLHSAYVPEPDEADGVFSVSSAELG